MRAVATARAELRLRPSIAWPGSRGFGGSARDATEFDVGLRAHLSVDGRDGDLLDRGAVIEDGLAVGRDGPDLLCSNGVAHRTRSAVLQLCIAEIDVVERCQ
jgi:hypothetical protein